MRKVLLLTALIIISFLVLSATNKQVKAFDCPSGNWGSSCTWNCGGCGNDAGEEEVTCDGIVVGSQCSGNCAGSCCISTGWDCTGNTYHAVGQPAGMCLGLCHVTGCCQGGCTVQTEGPCPCVANQGQSCNANQCGDGGGTVNCDGSCSAGQEPPRGNFGQACNRNNCGGTGTYDCNGVCNAAAPSCAPACLGYSSYENPAENATFIIGNTYTNPISGWATFCTGPNGTNRNRVDIYNCNSAGNCSNTPEGQGYIGHGDPYSRTLPDWTCGPLNSNFDGYYLPSWTIPNTPGWRRITVASINDAAATCVTWGVKNVLFSCASTNGQACSKQSPPNACGQLTITSGTYNCYGVCNAADPGAAPTNPAYYGQACEKRSASNACGAQNITYGIYGCNGTNTYSNCNAADPGAAPANPAYYGQACSKTSIRNMCGAQNTNYGTYGCNGTNTDSNCSATLPTSPALPAGCTYSWQTGASWGACSVTCGGGTQSRSVWCLRSDGTTVADSYCTGTKPASSQACNTQCCLVPGTWGAPLGTCTAACGGGTQTMTCNGASCGGTCSGSGSQSCNPQACPTCSTVSLLNGKGGYGLISGIIPTISQINYAYSDVLAGTTAGATCTVTVTGCGATINRACYVTPDPSTSNYRARVDFTPTLVNGACTVNFTLTPGADPCNGISLGSCYSAYGSACSKNSAPNSCGKTNITFGTTQCDGVTCNALTPTTPTACTPAGLAATCGGSATNPTAYLSWGSQAANGATSYNVTVNGTTTNVPEASPPPPSSTIGVTPGAVNPWNVAACGTTCSTATVPVPPTFTCGTTITPWIQTTGDVHSNTDINAPGGP